MSTLSGPAAHRNLVEAHFPLGASTGYMAELRGDWEAQTASARALSPFAVELSALAERELDALLAYLASEPALPFRYLSVHGPSKGRALPESELVELLAELPDAVDAIVMHPDTLDDAEPYLQLGERLVLENLDARKELGRTAEELASLFEALPQAGFCFDIAHAWSIDPTMAAAGELLDAFADRLRHVHLSSLDEQLHHVPLTPEHERLFEPLLARCADVPWILEAPPRD